MFNDRIKAGFLLLFLTALSAALATAQPRNLLRNPNADDGSNNWSASGSVSVERDRDGDPHFVVRNGGSFAQDIVLPKDSAGKFALLMGRGSSERINEGGAITGLPYLYGYMLEGESRSGGTIKEYLQGQQLLSNSKTANEWVTMRGVFEVPNGTGTIRFFLNQGERQGLPQNGSAARFDDLGLYLFDTAEEAKLFVDVTSKAVVTAGTIRALPPR